MITMFDTITPSQIPPSPQAVAGYVGGRWPDFDRLVSMFPHAHHLSIAVNAGEDAECLDIETGDATPPEGPAWVRRQQARGVHRPVLYANMSTMPAVQGALNSAGIPRAEVRLWVADFIFSPPSNLRGFDAWQWTDRALGRNLDQSVCTDSFFDTPKPPGPTGVANAEIKFDLGSGKWQVDPLAGQVRFSSEDKWASAELQINVKSGEWRVKPLPWNATPLGG